MAESSTCGREGRIEAKAERLSILYISLSYLFPKQGGEMDREGGKEEIHQCAPNESAGWVVRAGIHLGDIREQELM